MASILRTELNLAAYTGLTDTAAAALLNQRTKRGPIPAEDVRRYLHLNGKWAGVRAASLGLGGASEAARITALAFMDGLDSFVSFDLDAYEAAVSAQLDACVAVSLITTADKTAILALADNRRTRGEQIGAGHVKVGHVIEARAE
jgi:hypothetical protein